jgi:hypothetical protein
MGGEGVDQLAFRGAIGEVPGLDEPARSAVWRWRRFLTAENFRPAAEPKVNEHFGGGGNERNHLVGKQ